MIFYGINCVLRNTVTSVSIIGFEMPCCVCGYNVYRGIWAVAVGDVLPCCVCGYYVYRGIWAVAVGDVLPCCVCGCYVYRDIWAVAVGDVLQCKKAMECKGLYTVAVRVMNILNNSMYNIFPLFFADEHCHESILTAKISRFTL